MRYFLRTQAQYDAAPEGTEVHAAPEGTPCWAGPRCRITYVKGPYGWAGGHVPRDPMPPARREVLRWGGRPC